MIKLIIFDLDGVLIETKDLHFKALNKALASVGDQYVISKEEHIQMYDGKPTRVKLKMLTEKKGLPVKTHDIVYKRKQQLTYQMLEKMIEVDYNLTFLFENLSAMDYKIYIASNSIRKTVDVILRGLGIYKYIDGSLSNEDVSNSKPHPEMYIKCMLKANVGAKETLVIEDSYVGRKGAYRSGAYLYPINKPKDLTYGGLMSELKRNGNTTQKWQSDKLNILIPAGGAGKRFEKAGYTFPKILIDVNGKTMLQTVVENLNIDAHYIYIIQEAQDKQYNITAMLKLITPDCTVIRFKTLPEGAAHATLLAKEFIDNDQQLLIANSDQYVEWDSSAFMYAMQPDSIDAGILTFENTHPKWSYAKIDEDGWVTEVAEKNPISKHATVGIYFWKKGSDYIKYAEQMIKKEIRVNGEYYVCPVFNEAILDKKRIKTWNIEKMFGMGTPEDLERFLAICKKY